MSALSVWLAIPDNIRGGLSRYLVHGIRTGGFLEAFLENNLSEAIDRADSKSIACFREIMVFLHNYAPRGAYGHVGSPQSWLSISQAKRIEVIKSLADDAFDQMVADSGLAIDQ